MKSDFEKIHEVLTSVANPEDGLTLKELFAFCGQVFSVCSPKGRCFLIGGYVLLMCLGAALNSIVFLGLTDFLVPGMHLSASTSFFIALAMMYIHIPIIGLVKLKAINLYAPLFSMWLLSTLFPGALSFESIGNLLQAVVVLNLVIYAPQAIVLALVSRISTRKVQIGFPMKKTPWIFTMRMEPESKK